MIQKRCLARFQVDYPRSHLFLHRRKPLGLVATLGFDLGVSSQYLAGLVIHLNPLALAPSLDNATIFGQQLDDTFHKSTTNSHASPK
jgi:hypothetical protein